MGLRWPWAPTFRPLSWGGGGLQPAWLLLALRREPIVGGRDLLPHFGVGVQSSSLGGDLEQQEQFHFSRRFYPKRLTISTLVRRERNHNRSVGTLRKFIESAKH